MARKHAASDAHPRLNPWFAHFRLHNEFLLLANGDRCH